MSDGRASFTSLLEKIRNAYESDVCDEKSKVMALETKVKSLQREKSKLKQQSGRLKNELSKQTKMAVRATRDLRLEARKYQNRISQLVSHLKFVDKTVQTWIKKIRALNLDSHFGSLAHVENDISKTLTLAEQIERDVGVDGTCPDMWIGKIEDESSVIVCDEKEENCGLNISPPSKDSPIIPKSMEMSNSHQPVPGHRKTRIVLPAEQALCDASKAQDISGVSDPVSSLFLDRTSLITPIPQTDSHLSVDSTDTSQPSPEIPGRHAVKHMGGKRTTKLGRGRKPGKYMYADVSERKMRGDSEAVASTPDQEMTGDIEGNDSLYMEDEMTASEMNEVQAQYLVVPDTPGVMQDVVMAVNEESEYPDGGWTKDLCTGLRTPCSDMSMVLFSEDRNQTIRPQDIRDESTCWESPCGDDDDDDDDDDGNEGKLRDISTALLNGSLNQLRQKAQGCPVLSQLYYHVAKDDLDEVESDIVNRGMEAEKPKITDVQGREKGKRKQLGDELGFKYHEVIRKKDLRRQLNGHTCRCCEKFYEDQKLSPNSKHRLLKLVSRHKVIHTPPQTPPGFWSLRMPGSEECAAKGYIKDDDRPLKRRLANVLPETEGEDMSKDIAAALKNRVARLY